MTVRFVSFLLVFSTLVARAEQSQDTVQGIRVDPARGQIYVCGSTTGNLDGDNAGATDAWVAKLNELGVVQWIHQYGTVGDDTALGLALDGAGNVYVVGNTIGTPDLGGTNTYIISSWLNKYDAAGNLIFTRAVKTRGTTEGTGIDADRDGNVYLCGFTAVTLTNFGATTVNQGGMDAWFGKLDPNGNRLWLQQIGTSSDDVACAVAAGPGGSLYVSGFTEGSLGGNAKGARDIWIARYDANGGRMWVKQDGTTNEDVASKLDTDAAGNPILAGYTQGSFAARKRGAHMDSWVARYTAAGRRNWVRQLDSRHEDATTALAANKDIVDVAGDTDLGQGPHNAWLTKLSVSGRLNTTKLFRSGEEQVINGIDLDSLGNTFAAVSVKQAFDHGEVDSDVLIVKFDVNGEPVWSRSIQGLERGRFAKINVPEPGVTYVVRPQDTDAGINNWLDEHIIFHNGVASRNGHLIIFFPGSYAVPRSYLRLLKSFAASGHYVIGLTYPNSFDVLSLCDGNPANCTDLARNEILTGEDSSRLVAINGNNAIVNRINKLILLLHAQHPSEGWSQFYDFSNGQPVWSKLILAGHSQGGGHAAFIAKRAAVARVVMLAAPQDQAAAGVPSPWVTAPSATPADRFFGFGHLSDSFYSRFTTGWSALGLNNLSAPVNVDSAVRPFGNSHQLVTAAPPSDGQINGLKAHNSPAADIATPLLSDSTPIYGANEVWQYLVTTP